MITFNIGKIRLAGINVPLNINFGKDGMKKLVEEPLRRTTELYQIDIEKNRVETFPIFNKEALN